VTAIIFAGPSLPPRYRPAGEAIWEWRPPARQGDLYRAALERPSAIGLVDGYFEAVPAVWHKEILWAMAEGIHVFGAASIGALRAAELDRFGMRGIGRIYGAFRDGVLQDDDEVAVLHGPAELGYPAVTEAMVNIRATLAVAADNGVLPARSAADLAVRAKALFYKQRTWEEVLRSAAADDWPGTALRDFAAWLPTGRVDQKRRDAEEMLAAVRKHLAAGAGPLTVDYELADTVAWRAARREALSAPDR
jgi:hypothetical protein